MADTSGLPEEHTRRRPSERAVRRLLLDMKGNHPVANFTDRFGGLGCTA
jgi:hypothetical protein